MPEGKQIEAPNVLPEPARELWRAAFEDAWNRSCKAKAANGTQEACSAAAAWATVKERYRKGNDDLWVEKTFAELEIKVGKVPLPGSLYESPASAGLLWTRAYTVSMQSNGDIAESALRAWDKLKSEYTNGADGVWKKRNDMTIEPASVEAAEVEMAEPIVNRSVVAGSSYRMENTAVLLDGVPVDQEDAYVSKYGYELAERPQDWDWENWINRNTLGKTVEAVIRQKRISRAYLVAVERAKKQGWTAHVNPNGSDERIFGGWNAVGAVQRTWTKAILVTRDGAGTDPDDWVLQVVSNTQSSTIMVRSAPGWRRFRGPIIKSWPKRKSRTNSLSLIRLGEARGPS